MDQPFEIPKSYQIYIDQFEADPETAISRLEKHVGKRNTGAAGYFFLAWLYHKHDDSSKALQAAWKAKAHAPGSKLMERLHYFLVHPHAFDAWLPDSKQSEQRKESSTWGSHPIQDLDSLINKLSSIERTRTRLTPANASDKESRDLGENSVDVDDIVTETLATIHENQKNYSEAIKTYKKLQGIDPSKIEHYAEQIERLEKKLAEQEEK